MKSALLLATLLLCVSACQQEKTADITYLAIGDSITYGEKNTPGHAPGNYALQKLGKRIRFIKLGYPGETAYDFLTKHKQQALDSLKTVTGHVIGSVAYGANDLHRMGREKCLRDEYAVATWLHEEADVEKVVLIPVTPQKYTNSVEEDGTPSEHFNASRLWLNNHLDMHKPWALAAQAGNCPTMFRDEAFADSTRYADGVHPLDKGAKELGEMVIAPALVQLLH